MEIEYKNRIVAFIDVLGFKNIIYSDTTEPINAYYSFLLSNFSKSIQKEDFDYLLISDSIVVYTDDGIENLSKIIKLVNKLQAGLLGKGIIVRGAISHGDLYVDKTHNIIVGKGLINSYSLELKAKYPRVIIDRSIVEKYYDGFNDIQDKNHINGLPHVLVQPPSPYLVDYPYLNYGRLLATSMSNKPFEFAISLFKDNYYKNEQVEKFEWLRAHIIMSLNDQITYLESLDTMNEKERVKSRKCAKYLDEFESL